MAAYRIFATAVGFLVMALATGAACARGPDETALRAEVEEKLNASFKSGLFEVAGLKRLGSAPLPASDTGAARYVVYFNLSLALRENYNFSDWEGLSASSLAHVLGASEKGITGIGEGALQPGDIVRVYGSSTYEVAGDQWQPVLVTSAPAAGASAEPGNAAPPSQSQQFLNQLASMIEVPPPGVTPQHERIIAEELAHAVGNIARRRERERHTFVVASGPAGSEAASLANAIVAAVVNRRAGISVQALETGGSVENLRRLSAGEADYAIVESNVALMALEGSGPFAGRAAPKLAAVGSLFPLSMHVVVLADSPIRQIADLKRRRVNVGGPDSANRFDALAILRAHGIAVTDLAEATELGTAQAARMLQDRRLDAIFVGGGAPMRDLQRLAAEQPIRFLSVDDAALARVLDENARIDAADPARQHLSRPGDCRHQRGRGRATGGDDRRARGRSRGAHAAPLREHRLRRHGERGGRENLEADGAARRADSASSRRSAVPRAGRAAVITRRPVVH